MEGDIISDSNAIHATGVLLTAHLKHESPIGDWSKGSYKTG